MVKTCVSSKHQNNSVFALMKCYKRVLREGRNLLGVVETWDRYRLPSLFYHTKLHSQDPTDTFTGARKGFSRWFGASGSSILPNLVQAKQVREETQVTSTLMAWSYVTIETNVLPSTFRVQTNPSLPGRQL